MPDQIISGILMALKRKTLSKEFEESNNINIDAEDKLSLESEDSQEKNSSILKSEKDDDFLIFGFNEYICSYETGTILKERLGEKIKLKTYFT